MACHLAEYGHVVGDNLASGRRRAHRGQLLRPLVGLSVFGFGWGPNFPTPNLIRPGSQAMRWEVYGLQIRGSTSRPITHDYVQ